MEGHEIVKHLLVNFLGHQSEEKYIFCQVEVCEQTTFFVLPPTFSELQWLFLPPAPQHPLQPRQVQSRLPHRSSHQTEPQPALSALDLQAGQQCFRIDSFSNFGINNFLKTYCCPTLSRTICCVSNSHGNSGKFHKIFTELPKPWVNLLKETTWGDLSWKSFVYRVSSAPLHLTWFKQFEVLNTFLLFVNSKFIKKSVPIQPSEIRTSWHTTKDEYDWHSHQWLLQQLKSWACCNLAKFNCMRVKAAGSATMVMTVSH